MSDDSGTGWAAIEHVQAAIESALPGGDLLAHLIDHIPGVRMERARGFLSQLLDLAERDATFVVKRINEKPALGRLLWDSTRGCADTEIEAKIRAFARVAARAVVDDAELDVAQLIVGALLPLENIHIAALRILADQAQAGVGSGAPLHERLGVGPDIAEAITLTLRSVALSSSSERAASNLRPPRISAFGERVLAYLSG